MSLRSVVIVAVSVVDPKFGQIRQIRNHNILVGSENLLCKTNCPLKNANIIVGVRVVDPDKLVGSGSSLQDIRIRNAIKDASKNYSLKQSPGSEYFGRNKLLLYRTNVPYNNAKLKAVY